MELVDKNKITFEPIKIYNIDEHKHEITGMALFKDIEKIPIIKAIPLDEIKQAREKIMLLDSLLYRRKDGVTEYVNITKVLGILNRLIKEYESEEKYVK